MDDGGGGVKGRYVPHQMLKKLTVVDTIHSDTSSGSQVTFAPPATRSEYLGPQSTRAYNIRNAHTRATTSADTAVA